MNKYVLLIVGVCLASLLAGCAVGTAGSPPHNAEAPAEDALGRRTTAGGQPAGSTGQASDLDAERYARQQATSGQPDVDPQTGLNHLVIYNASLELTVQDALKASEEVRRIAQAAGGYLAASNSYRDEGLLRASLTVRVPSEKLVETLEQLKKIAKQVERESLDSQDVTDEYTDAQSRLRNLEASEAQYLKILERAGNIEDVLAVQLRLDEVRGQIEQTKGRIEYLSKSAAFATITITLTPDALARPISVGGWQPQGTARDALEALLWALRTLVDILIWAAICILPIGLILGLPLFFAIRWARRRVRGRAPKSAGGEK